MKVRQDFDVEFESTLKRWDGFSIADRGILVSNMLSMYNTIIYYIYKKALHHKCNINFHKVSTLNVNITSPRLRI